jgi:hypothetical protein
MNEVIVAERKYDWIRKTILILRLARIKSISCDVRIIIPMH